jgi:hypothetical protein
MKDTAYLLMWNRITLANVRMSMRTENEKWDAARMQVVGKPLFTIELSFMGNQFLLCYIRTMLI